MGSLKNFYSTGALINMFFIAKTPAVLKWVYPSCIWNIPNNNNAVFLTFDDGPTNLVTDQVLTILEKEGAKATFFCVGSQIEKNPALYRKIIDKGHAIGNHTFNHLNGWKTNRYDYFNNIDRCQKLTSSSLFRPPYGKISSAQIKKLKKQYKIIMWDVAGGDFLSDISSEKIVKNVVDNTSSGSIIVLHDNIKFGDKMLKALPKLINQLKDKGFVLERIPIDVPD